MKIKRFSAFLVSGLLIVTAAVLPANAELTDESSVAVCSISGETDPGIRFEDRIIEHCAAGPALHKFILTADGIINLSKFVDKFGGYTTYPRFAKKNGTKYWIEKDKAAHGGTALKLK